MKGTAKVLKGRIEEAAGALVGNDKLREKGRTDQAVGEVIRAGEKGIRKANEAADRIVVKAHETADAAVEEAKNKKEPTGWPTPSFVPWHHYMGGLP